MVALDLRVAARRVMPGVPELPHLRESAVQTWRGRMVNEHGSARVFEGLAGQIREAGLGEGLADECLVFAEEERRHGVLCGSVVEALGGEAVAPALADEELPLHGDVAPIEGVLRNLLSISCLSETVAVALIGAERLAMPEGELRALLSTIWADEVGHARFGWGIVSRQVPRLDEAARRRLGAYLRVAFGHLERHELAHLPLSACPPPEGAALGLCAGGEARSLFADTVASVIVPGLASLGLPAREAWASRVAPAVGAGGMTEKLRRDLSGRARGGSGRRLPWRPKRTSIVAPDRGLDGDYLSSCGPGGLLACEVRGHPGGPGVQPGVRPVDGGRAGRERLGAGPGGAADRAGAADIDLRQAAAR